MSSVAIFSQPLHSFRIADLLRDLKWWQYVCAEENFLAAPGTL